MTDLQDRPPVTTDVRSSSFYDQSTYERELAMVFRRSWLFVGHDTMIPNSGDYVSTYMGDDAVILCRGRDGEARVLLNKCRHRGNKVCLFDKGNTTLFRCSYHGWSYDTTGKLRGVPLEESAYDGRLDREQLGLVAPRVETYKGLIFATWEENGLSLEQYLGADLLWYLDNFLVDTDPQGLEVVPGLHRYIMPVNWKLLAENFGGDMYHFDATHASLMATIRAGQGSRIASPQAEETGSHYSVQLTDGGAPHGLLQLAVGENFYNDELKQTQPLGREAVEWLAARHERLRERLADAPTRPYGFHVANIFPNFSLIGVGSAMYGRGFIVWQPRGPRETEVWQWCFVEKSAPAAVKDRMVFVLSQRQSAAGMVAPDDHENFERMSDAMATSRAREVPFHYELGRRAEEQGSIVPTLPGLVQPAISETYQRLFYRHWDQLMASR